MVVTFLGTAMNSNNIHHPTKFDYDKMKITPRAYNSQLPSPPLTPSASTSSNSPSSSPTRSRARLHKRRKEKQADSGPIYRIDNLCRVREYLHTPKDDEFPGMYRGIAPLGGGGLWTPSGDLDSVTGHGSYVFELDANLSAGCSESKTVELSPHDLEVTREEGENHTWTDSAATQIPQNETTESCEKHGQTRPLETPTLHSRSSSIYSEDGNAESSDPAQLDASPSPTTGFSSLATSTHSSPSEIIAEGYQALLAPLPPDSRQATPCPSIPTKSISRIRPNQQDRFKPENEDASLLPLPLRIQRPRLPRKPVANSQQKITSIGPSSSTPDSTPPSGSTPLVSEESTKQPPLGIIPILPSSPKENPISVTIIPRSSIPPNNQTCTMSRHKPLRKVRCQDSLRALASPTTATTTTTTTEAMTTVTGSIAEKIDPRRRQSSGISKERHMTEGRVTMTSPAISESKVQLPAAAAPMPFPPPYQSSSPSMPSLPPPTTDHPKRTTPAIIHRRAVSEPRAPPPKAPHHRSASAAAAAAAEEETRWVQIPPSPSLSLSLHLLTSPMSIRILREHYAMYPPTPASPASPNSPRMGSKRGGGSGDSKGRDVKILIGAYERMRGVVRREVAAAEEEEELKGRGREEDDRRGNGNGNGNGNGTEATKELKRKEKLLSVWIEALRGLSEELEGVVGS